MNIKQIEKILVDSGIEKNEAKIEAKMLVEHFLGLSDIDLALTEELKAREDLLEKLKNAANLRAQKRIPIQHIIGTAYFMGEDFIVNENVLIPRDETEILVRKAVELLNGRQKTENRKWTILDIGTGSGCIACIIAKLTGEKVLGVDISTDALQIALDNSSKLKLFNKAIFRKSDIFSNIKTDEKFDIIISNPPYIPLKEKENIQIEVQFEPKSALFAKDKKGIEFYDKIITKSPEFLNKEGYLMFELGIGQADLVKKLMEKQGFKDIQVEKDLSGIERVILGKIEI